MSTPFVFFLQGHPGCSFIVQPMAVVITDRWIIISNSNWMEINSWKDFNVFLFRK